MAWNQPNTTGHSARRSTPRKAYKGIWLVVATFSVIAAVGLVIALLPREKVTPSTVVEVPTKTQKNTQKKSSPVSAPKPQEATEVKVDPNARPTKVGEVVNGYVMLPSGRIHKPTGVVTNRVADYGKSKYSIFENRSDNEIAGILMANPGEAVVGTKRYDKWFEKQFLKSIETPITVSPDDEPWQADLKKLVIQARLELKEAHDKGEDIAAIMSESRQQLQDLAKYKQSVKQIYAQNVKECATEQDVADLQNAVNVMLEEKGCAPMNLTLLTKMRLMKGKTDE